MRVCSAIVGILLLCWCRPSCADVCISDLTPMEPLLNEVLPVCLWPIRGDVVRVTFAGSHVGYEKLDHLLDHPFYEFDPRRQVPTRKVEPFWDTRFTSEFSPATGLEVRRLGHLKGREGVGFCVDFTYDASGRVTQLDVRGLGSCVDGNIVTLWNLTYDKNGRLYGIEERAGRMKGTEEVVKIVPWYKETRGYDKAGRIVTRQTRYMDLRGSCVVRYSYDSQSNLSLEERSYETGNDERSKYSGYKVDAHGNWVERTLEQTAARGAVRDVFVERRIIEYAAPPEDAGPKTR